MDNTQLNNFKLNVFKGIQSQILVKLLSFINRTVFIYSLGYIYLGVSSVFTNVLSLLSLAELGIGSAIIYHLYKPLVSNDWLQTKALVRLYSKIYNFIGIFILVVGLLVLPFFDHLFKEVPNIPNLKIIYCLFLLNSSISYFMTHKRSLLLADKKNYEVLRIDNIVIILITIAQIIGLVWFKSYQLYLFIQIIGTLLANIFISRKVYQEYPFLRNKERINLDKNIYQQIKSNVLSVALLKFGGVMVNSTDNIIISVIVGLKEVGLYSNYLLIISIINSFISQIYTPLTPSLGQYLIENNQNQAFILFKNINFINTIIYGLMASIFYLFTNQFICLWIGSQYIFSQTIVLMIAINFYIMGIRRPIWSFNNAAGIFKEFRYYPILEVLINLISSVMLANYLGITGVLLGTFLSTVLVYFYIEPIILYKKVFNQKVSTYFINYFKYLLIFIVLSTIVNKLIINIPVTNFFILIIIIIFYIILYTSTIYFITKNTSESKYVIKLIIKRRDYK